MTTAQHPLPSGFGATTTAREAIAGHDLSGKTIIVTGGYSGIGLEATRAFVNAGARVVVPARTRSKAEENLTCLPVEIELVEPARATGCSISRDRRCAPRRQRLA